MARARILVVDDEPDILELVQYNLGKAQYDVVGVESGEEALVQVRSTPPDLIVLDLMLPGVDGLEVCRALKRDTRTAAIPIVMLTARGEEADIVAGLELGADDYLTKPFSPRVLLARYPGWVFTRDQIIAAAQGEDVSVTERSVDVHIVSLRRKLGTMGEAIETIRGVGYRLQE